MSFGFQRDGLRSDSSPFGGGGLGSGIGFGTQGFGGGGYPVYEPPYVQSGSDDPEQRLRTTKGESVMMRGDLPIAARVWATRGVWRIVYRHLDITDIQNLQTYHDLRRFRLLPDSLDESTYWIVRWVEKDFDPVRLRGGQEIWNLTFNLVEVP